MRETSMAEAKSGNHTACGTGRSDVRPPTLRC